jgi:hypothetical protein
MERATAQQSDGDEGPRGADRDDPCQLLSVAEVEAAIGPLAVPPYRAEENDDAPFERGDSCRYVARDDRNLLLNVSFTGGTALLNMFGAVNEAVKQATGGAGPGAGSDGAQVQTGGGSVLHKTDERGDKGEKLRRGSMPKEFLPYDIPYAGEWDDVRVLGCCRLNTFLDDSAVVLDFSGSKLTPAQAVALVNKALLRLKTPIATIDGRVGVGAAKERLATRAKHARACDLVPRAAAEAILGARLSTDPSGDDDKCEYRYRSAAGDDTDSDDTVAVEVKWRFGFSDYREGGAIEGAAARALPGVKGIDNAANLGAGILSGMQDKMKQGGDSFESLGKAIQEVAAQAQGRKTATPEGAKDAPKVPDHFTGPWDEARWSYPDFIAVHKDIEIVVKAGLKPDIGKQFAAKAFETMQ